MTQPRQAKEIDLAGAIARLGDSRRIVMTTHARADGDAIGSLAGLRRVLQRQGHAVQAFVHEPVPVRYGFLPDTDQLGVWDASDAGQVVADADLVLIVDTCARSQLGDVCDAIVSSATDVMVIDHHLTRDPVADVVLVDESAGACTRIIHDLCQAAEWPVDEAAATLLFAGLATDTGWFRFSNAGPGEYETAATLVRRGARPNELYERLYLSDIEPRVRLVGAVLSTFDLLCDGRLAIMRITQDILKQCGASNEMTDEIINEPQRIGSVVACVLVSEPADDGPVRVSFRSKRDVDVAEIAKRFGGGGHARAAGAKITATFDDAIRQVTAAMIEAVERIAGDSA